MIPMTPILLINDLYRLGDLLVSKHYLEKINTYIEVRTINGFSIFSVLDGIVIYYFTIRIKNGNVTNLIIIFTKANSKMALSRIWKN